MCGDAPLAFLAQVDLEAAPKAAWPDWMPRVGRLLFFFDERFLPSGYAEERGRWSVIYHDAPADSVADRVPPATLPALRRWPRKDMTLLEKRSVMGFESAGGYAANLAPSDFEVLVDRFSNLEETLDGPQPSHRLFGLASASHGDAMGLECQLAFHGFALEDADGNSTSEALGLISGAADWELLLQLESDDDADMMWGDGGALYFWVRRDDAAKRDFSTVWLVRQ
jgi:hypothetical protein